MNFQLPSHVRNILILGAGASAEYGLPVWDELGPLITAKIRNDFTGAYQYKEEILTWINKIGQGKKYVTLDQCLQVESAERDFHTTGTAVENQIFLILKDIFTERYNLNGDGGWIRKLNEKLLRPKSGSPGTAISFINYNYDDVLERNLLNFEYLPDKHKRLNFRDRLKELSEKEFATLYPHGNLFSVDELSYRHNVSRSSHTMKSGEDDFVDAVSCLESYPYRVITGPNIMGLTLYILGLGGGLQINLGNLDFDVSVSRIHVTIRNPAVREGLVNYLIERFQIPSDKISVYDDCQHLVESCF